VFVLVLHIHVDPEKTTSGLLPAGERFSPPGRLFWKNKTTPRRQAKHGGGANSKSIFKIQNPNA